MVYAGPIFYPAEAARDLLRPFRDWAPDAPDDDHCARQPDDRAAAAGDPGGVARQEGRGVDRASRRARSTRASASFARFRAVAEPIADLLGPMPYQVIQTLIDPLWPKGIRAYFKATNLARLDDALIDSLCELHLAAPGAAVRDPRAPDGRRDGARRPTDATAFAERSMPFLLNAGDRLARRGRRDASHRSGRASVIAAADDASTGRAYVNFLGDADAARSSYGAETYASLVALKNEYDPTNVFRLQPEHRARRRVTSGGARRASLAGARPLR